MAFPIHFFLLAFVGFFFADHARAEIGFTPYCNSGWTTLNDTWISAECGLPGEERKWTSINLDECFACWHGVMIISIHEGGIKDCTKDCRRTSPHKGYEKAPWMCKVKADNDDPDDYAWDMMDLDWLLRYLHGENRICCGNWGRMHW
ncbi:hypothetical protein Micbo1qcDRAFT_218976 [Microdochium bolleyi]|uniref:Cyanovirin-N domain-containing protein n=1 Tax=Microdochium bolleyi TaxID=196109 RepID=A0A136IPE3_9PEZI|nr:hypothetical protein Micbo1qcDRAFT_218976 [Microdochium bolleyi]